MILHRFALSVLALTLSSSHLGSTAFGQHLDQGPDLPNSLLEAIGTLPEFTHDIVWSPSTQIDGASGTWGAANPSAGLQSTFTSSGMAIHSWHPEHTWGVGLTLESFGREKRRTHPGSAVVEVDGNRIQLVREGVTEWYVNRPGGLEQGFTIHSAPPGQGPLQLALMLDGKWEAEVLEGSRDAILRCRESGRALTYSGLVVFDAEGSHAPARLEATKGGLIIEVSDEGLSYPVTIDPVIAAQHALLTGTPQATEAYFGQAVAISGDLAAVGAWNDVAPGATRPGAVYIFERSGTQWVQQAKLSAAIPQAGAWFGLPLVLEGTTLVVGSYGRSTSMGNEAGAVHVFEYCQSTWTEIQMIEAMAGGILDGSSGDRFGYSIDLDGDRLVAGAYSRGVTGLADAGAAYTYTRDDQGTSDPCDDEFVDESVLTAAPPAAGDHFGFSVAIDDDTIAVGARNRNNPPGPNNQGAVFVYERSGSTWSLVSQLYSPTPSAGAALGSSVDLEGSSLLAGAPLDDTAGSNAGSVYAFERSFGTWISGTPFVLTAGTMSGAGDYFGTRVRMSGPFCVIGARYDDVFPSDSGSAFVFEKTGGQWPGTPATRILASDGSSNDDYGFSVAIDGIDVIVGAREYDSASSQNGAAYVYQLTQTPQPDIAYHGFGNGAGVACPCGNNGPSEAEHGCVNSRGFGGRLSAFGSNSLAADDLQFVGWNLVPNNPALLFVAENEIPMGLAFGDGLRVCGGFTVRLGVSVPGPNGRATWGPGLQPAAGPGIWNPGVTRCFQIWYRDPGFACTGAGFNLSNGMTVTMRP